MKKLMKRIMPVVLAICLVFSQMSLTALAMDTENIDRDSAMVVTEDQTITGTIDQLVLVDAPVKVDVSDATLTVGIFVSPDAAEAEVVISGETTVAEVVVAAESASVKVEETVSVESVTVDAPKASVEVAGEVKALTVAEAAEGASVVVAETATVAALEVAAPSVTAEVAGTVETVTVAETATGAELVVAETAAVGAVSDATGELTVSGDGAENVTVEDTSAPAEGEDEEEDKKDEDKSDEDSTPSTGDDYLTPVVPVEPTEPDEGGDDTNKPGTGEENPKPTDPSAPKITWGTVSGTATQEGTTVTPTTFKTEASNGKNTYWVGFSVKVEEKEGFEYTVAVKSSNATVDTTNADFIWVNVTDLVNTAVSSAANDFTFVTEDDAENDVTANVTYDETSGKWTLSDNALDGVTVSVENGSVKVELTVTETATVDPEDAEGTPATPKEYDYSFTVNVPTGDLTANNTIGTAVEGDLEAAVEDKLEKAELETPNTQDPDGSDLSEE